MNEHLPECWAKHESDPPAWCICDELRACEERVREDEQSNNFSPDIHWDGMAESYQRGLDAAREALFGAKAIDVYYGRGLDEPPQFIWLNNALAAIDALRRKENDEAG